MAISWAQALAWRLERQLLDPIGKHPVEDVVRRLAAIQSGDGFATELAVRTRRQESRAGEVGEALRDGRLIKSFAFRGATHLMTPDEGGIYLALRASAGIWKLPSWQAHYRLAPEDWPALREVVREALDAGPLTVKELVAAIAAQPRFSHLGEILPGNPWNVMKVLAWNGDLSFGPLRGRQPTLQRLDGNPRWAGVPDVDAAGARAVEAYLGAYGPATRAHLQYWLGSGLGAGKGIARWIESLGDRITEVDVEGTMALMLRDHLEALRATAPSASVRLLPAYDQWLLGPGTADPHVVPAARRAAASRGANVVVVGGAVAGTWSFRDGSVQVDWFAESGRPPSEELDTEVARLATMLDRPLAASVQVI